MPRKRHLEEERPRTGEPGAGEVGAEREYTRRHGCRGEADVILDVVFEDGLLFLSVANIGDRPAYRVRVRFEEQFTGLGGTTKMHALALFRRLEFLAPRKEIRANFNFLVEIAGEALAGFSEIDLPDSRIEVIEYREGGDRSSAARKLPGRVKHENVVLRRGLTGSTDLYDWFRSVLEGVLDRRDVVITLRDEGGNAVLAWQLRRAWPARYAFSQLGALGNEVVVETLELAHEGFEVV